MEKPIVSVIIPVYNGAAFLERAAESVLRQPCADRLELLIVDDGSTDGTGAICDEIAARHPAPAVRVFHQENGGAFSARNLGIREARGAFLGFLDADDWWEADFFDESLLALLEEGFDLYRFSYHAVSLNRRWEKPYAVQDEALRDLPPDPERPYTLGFWSCLYSRKLLDRHQIRYLPVKINEDIPFAHLTTALASSIRFSSKIMLGYWVNPTSCIHSHTQREILETSRRAFELEEADFRAKGFADYSTKRQELTMILEKLPRLCCEMRWSELKAYLAGPDFDILRQDELRPWREAEPILTAWRAHPFRFWLRARLHPGISLFLKRHLFSLRILQPVVSWFQYKLMFRWNRVR